MKYLKYLIIVVLIVVIGLVIFIASISSKDGIDTYNEISLNKKNQVISNNAINYINTSNVDNGEPGIEELENYGDKMTISGNVQKVTSENTFFMIEKCVQNYINNISNKDTIAIYNQLSPEYISKNNIDQSNVLQYVDNISGTQNFRALKMNYVQGEVYDQYSVYGKLLGNSGKTADICLILNMNSGDLRYSIIPQIGKNDLSQVKIGISTEDVIENSNNQGKYVRVTDEYIIKDIMEDYRLNVIYDTQSAYNSLNKEYCKERFTDYNDFYKYAQNNISKIQELTLTKYSKTEKANYTEYVCKDMYGNIYTIKSTGVREYDIILDDYTLEDKLSYQNISNEELVKKNVSKVLKMLNTCDYSHLYKLLNDNFKMTYFGAQADFENYAKSNLFAYNVLDKIEITENEDNVYICSITVKDRNAVGANTMDKTIIMKLGSGTNFEMSFDV